MVRPASFSPTWIPPTITAGTTTYTVVVRCAAEPMCEGRDDVVVEVRACPLSVRFDRLDAAWPTDGTALQVTWSTLSEDGTTAFQVERGAAADGPFQPVGAPVLAAGAGHPYRFTDPTAAPATRPWYRVVELVGAERGDRSPAFRTRAPSGRGGGRTRTSR